MGIDNELLFVSTSFPFLFSKSPSRIVLKSHARANPKCNHSHFLFDELGFCKHQEEVDRVEFQESVCLPLGALQLRQCTMPQQNLRMTSILYSISFDYCLCIAVCGTGAKGHSFHPLQKMRGGPPRETKGAYHVAVRIRGYAFYPHHGGGRWRGRRLRL